MFLVLLNNFDESIRSGKCANRFYNYRYSCLKYHNIYFTIYYITSSNIKFSQLKKVLSSFLCSFEIPSHICTVVPVVLVCSSYNKIFLGDILCQQNIIIININTVSQSQYHTVFQYRRLCTIHSTISLYCTVHKENINFKTVFKYRTLCTM